MAFKAYVILRSPRGGRLEGRKMVASGIYLPMDGLTPARSRLTFGI